MKIKLYDVVALNSDTGKLKANMIGTVVEIYDDGKGFEVEFLDDDGHVIESVALAKEQIRKLSEAELEKIN